MILDFDNQGTGVDIHIVANQGSDPDGVIRYNSSSNLWQLSHDGVLYDEIATATSIDFEDVYANDADDTLTTGNGNVTVNSGTGDVIISSNDWSVNAAGTASVFSLTSGDVTANGTLDANGVVTLGDGADNVVIDSNDWDVSSAGVASGFTGITSTGTIDFNGASNIIIPHTESNTFVLDNDNTGGNVTLQFGLSLAESLVWDNASSEFDLSDDLNVTGGLIVSSDIDFNQNNAVELVLDQGSSFPVSPAPIEGQKFWRSDLNQEFVYNGTVWVSTSESDNNRTIVYFPEYADAVVSMDGAENDGTLESERDGENFRNFYEWRVNKATLQDIDVVLSVELPEDFSSFQATPLQVAYRTSDADVADAQIDITVLDTANAAVTTSGATDLNNTSWTTANITFSGSPTFTPGGVMTIRFKLQARKDGTAQSAFINAVHLNYIKL